MRLMAIRKDLRFNKELLVLVETLKNIAASQYHAMEKAKERFDRFMDSFSGFFRVVDMVVADEPLVKVMSDTLGIVVVTSDSGFMGGLNQGVLRRALEIQGRLTDEKTALIVVGDKGASVLGDMRRKFKFFPGINQDTIYEQAVQIKDYIVDEVMRRRIGRTVVVYPKPVSFTAQTIEAINILPCGQLFDRTADSEVAQRTRGQGLLAESTKVIVESSFSDMVEYLAGVWVTSKLYEVFEDSKLAEFSARAMHLEGSKDKVQKLCKKLEHMAFKAAHEKIDKGMRESFSAVKVKKSGKARAQRREAAQAAEALAG